MRGPRPERNWVVGIDIGGTFTDAIATGADGAVRVAKVPSTPDDPGMAFGAALAELAAAGVDAAQVAMIVHGTTVATNALLTRRLARVALACTQGFGDVLSYRDGTRPKVYDLAQPRPRPLAARRDRVEVAERLSGQGAVVMPLTGEEIERAAAEVADRNPGAVAVAFLFSYLDDSHERALGEAIGRLLPGVPVTLSSAVAREFREYPRTATAVVNAGLRPVVGRYLLGLRDRVAQAEQGRSASALPLLIMQSNGGCLPAERAEEQSHALVLSGPAAGVAGAVALGEGYGLRQLISLDMGGTSLDVCLVRDGVPPTVASQVVDGNPILCPSVDIVTVGAGGGSIAAVDRAGRLRVGPDSAGAAPGPAAYGLGGERATLTDAHVVAGTLPAGLPLAGRLTLDPDAARKVIESVGSALGMSAEDAADGIMRLAVAQMTAALRRVSVERGIDPRDYTLVAFGGAGPLHAGLLLREMGLARVLIPRYPGLFAAAGLTATDIRLDESRTVLATLGADLITELASWYREAARNLTARMRRDGIPAGRVRVAASADCRFAGQGYELPIPVAFPARAGLARLAEAFRAEHRRVYGHANPDQDVEVVTVRVSAFGALPARTEGGEPGADESAGVWRATSPATAARIGRTRARLPGTRAARQVGVWDRERIRPGEAVVGPAIVSQLDATTLVLAGQRARADERGSMWLEEAR